MKNRDPSTICANPFWATSAPSWRFGSAGSRFLNRHCGSCGIGSISRFQFGSLPFMSLEKERYRFGGFKDFVQRFHENPGVQLPRCVLEQFHKAFNAFFLKMFLRCRRLCKF